jgi:hypothetical protein
VWETGEKRENKIKAILRKNELGVDTSGLRWHLKLFIKNDKPSNSL